MRLPIITAVVDARWESGLVAAFGSGEHGVTVVRRCVDLPDLLATAATRTARAVLLSADLRRLDRDALTRLGASGLAVVGLVPPADEDAERRLRQLGVRWVVAADTAADVIAAALHEAVAALDGGPGGGSIAFAMPLGGLPDAPVSDPSLDHEPVPGTGRLIAVWGSAGAPGRTTVAVNLAAELAGLGVETLLVDADPYGGLVAQALGLLEEAPGLAAACRQANAGTLDVPALGRSCRQVVPRLRVLTGINRADRWPELRPAALEVVLALARTLAAVTVVDCGFSLEQDEELSYDTAAPRRNGATLTVLDQADTVVTVIAAEPPGVTRAIRGLTELREVVPGVEPLVVLNKARRSAVGGDPAEQVGATLQRYAGVEPAAVLPYDRTAVDAAMLAGRALREAAAGSPLRRGLATLATQLSGTPVSRTGRRRARGLLAGSTRR